MNYKIQITQSGRGGTIFYIEDEKKLSFDWEFSMTGSTIFVPTPTQWNAFCTSGKFEAAQNKRQEILESIGIEVCRQKASGGKFEIQDNFLEILF